MWVREGGGPSDESSGEASQKRWPLSCLLRDNCLFSLTILFHVTPLIPPLTLFLPQSQCSMTLHYLPSLCSLSEFFMIPVSPLFFLFSLRDVI